MCNEKSHECSVYESDSTSNIFNCVFAFRDTKLLFSALKKAAIKLPSGKNYKVIELLLFSVALIIYEYS